MGDTKRAEADGESERESGLWNDRYGDMSRHDSIWKRVVKFFVIFGFWIILYTSAFIFLMGKRALGRDFEIHFSKEGRMW